MLTTSNQICKYPVLYKILNPVALAYILCVVNILARLGACYAFDATIVW